MTKQEFKSEYRWQRINDPELWEVKDGLYDETVFWLRNPLRECSVTERAFAKLCKKRGVCFFDSHIINEKLRGNIYIK